MNRKIQFKILNVMLFLLLGMGTLLSAKSVFVPKDFSTLQGAIDQANEGDEIIIAQGTYVENLFITINITLRSSDPENASVVAQTIIDGGKKGSCITLSSTQSDYAVIDGLTLTNGYSRWGAGIVSDGEHTFGTIGSTATIRNCLIIANDATRSGGGIGNCDGLIENCTISNNTCIEAGAGLWHCDGTIKNNLIENNSSAYQGGGMCGCGASIIQNRIINNVAVHQGGGINKSSGKNCVIESNTITNNTSDYGGGICDSKRAQIGQNDISGNISLKHDGQIYDFSN